MEVIFNPNSFLLVNSAHSQYHLDLDAKSALLLRNSQLCEFLFELDFECKIMLSKCGKRDHNLRHGHISITGKKGLLSKVEQCMEHFSLKGHQFTRPFGT